MNLLQKFSGSTKVSWSTLVYLIEPETYAEKVKSPLPTPPRSPVWFGSGAKPKGNQGEKTAEAAMVVGPKSSRKKPAPQPTRRPREEQSGQYCRWCCSTGHRFEDCWGSVSVAGRTDTLCLNVRTVTDPPVLPDDRGATVLWDGCLTMVLNCRQGHRLESGKIV